MMRQLGIAALIMSAVVACGRPADRQASSDADPGAPPVWVSAACPAQDIDPFPLFDAMEKAGGIPADFVATSVVRCRNEIRPVPGEGDWTVQITERADTRVSQLVDTLRLPSGTPPAGQVACPDIAYSVPYFLLVDAEGRALLPTVPTEDCGKPRDEVTSLLDTLPYRTVTESRVALSRSPGGTGCHDLRKNTIAVASPEPAAAGPVWHSAGEVRVCLYTLTGEYGELDTGYSLSGQDAAALKTALGAAGPAIPCDRPPTRFAVLRVWSGSAATVELDGCFRVHRPNNTLGQLDGSVLGR